MERFSHSPHAKAVSDEPLATRIARLKALSRLGQRTLLASVLAVGALLPPPAVLAQESHTSAASVEETESATNPTPTREAQASSPEHVIEDVIDVAPSRFTLLQRDSRSRWFLNRDEVERLPHLSDDLYRAVSRLPGSAAGDLSAEFHVRGGEVSELQVLVDGLEIYEPFHLKGLHQIFSIIDSKAVGSLDFFSGGFTAEYGDRMSGVLDISSASPIGRRNSAGLSFVHARLMSEGTFNEGRGQWLASARRGYLDVILDAVQDDDDDFDLDPTYYDLFAKVQLQKSDRTFISANVLAAHDDLAFVEDDGLQRLTGSAGNAYVWLNVKNAWSDRLFSETVVSLGLVDTERRGGSDDLEGYETCTDCLVSTGTVNDDRSLLVAGLKQNWSSRLSKRHQLKWGFDVRHSQAEFDYRGTSAVLAPLVTGSEEIVRSSRRVEIDNWSNDFGLYVADQIRLTDKLTVEVGARWDDESHTPDGSELSPRVNLLYRPGERTSLRAAWGRFRQAQYLHELQVEDGLTDYFRAQSAEHRILTLEHAFDRGVFLRVEAFDKQIDDPRPRFENLWEPIDLIPEAELDRVEVAPESAEIRGAEILVDVDTGGPLTGWLSYAYATADDVIDGEDVPRSWDQRHAATLALDWRLGEAWSLDAVWAYHSGWPTTPVSARTEVRDGVPVIVPVVGARNSERYPDYHRLDLRASRRVKTRYGALAFFFEVTNLLDRDNVRGISHFDFDLAPGGGVDISPERETWLPRVPSFGVTWEF